MKPNAQIIAQYSHTHRLSTVQGKLHFSQKTGTLKSGAVVGKEGAGAEYCASKSKRRSTGRFYFAHFFISCQMHLTKTEFIFYLGNALTLSPTNDKLALVL